MSEASVDLGLPSWSRRERATALALLIASIAARIASLFRYRVDSDELQHLHVAWGWSRGLLQYRDVFDNHSPLFHILTSPLFLVVGERPDIVVLARVLMLPLLLVTVACVYVVASRAFSPNVGFWSALAVTVTPILFSRTLEYRTDTLWFTFWMLALATIASGAPTPRRMFFLGLILGCALSVSMKTTLLAGSILLAALGTLIILNPRPRVSATAIASAIGGLAAVPTALLLYFASRGALDDLFYCVVTYNSKFENPRPLALVWRGLMPFAIAGMWLLARRLAKGTPDRDQQAVRTFLLLFVAVFLAILLAFWPVISERDFLPVLPPAVVLATGWLLDGSGSRRRNFAIAASVLAIFSVFAMAHARRDDMRATEANLARVLAVTRSGDFVFDYKGESVFRSRPYWYIFEKLGRSYFAGGQLKDTGPEAAIVSRCYVASENLAMFPKRTADFLSRYFVNDGELRVAGARLLNGGRFEIAIPGEYSLVTPAGRAVGEIDSRPVQKFVFLTRGVHELRALAQPGPVAVIWRGAADRGFSPFVQERAEQ